MLHEARVRVYTRARARVYQFLQGQGRSASDGDALFLLANRRESGVRIRTRASEARPLPILPFLRDFEMLK